MSEIAQLPELLTLREASARLRLGRNRLRELIHAGSLRAVQPGGRHGRLYITVEEIREFLRRHSTGSTAA